MNIYIKCKFACWQIWKLRDTSNCQFPSRLSTSPSIQQYLPHATSTLVVTCQSFRPRAHSREPKHQTSPRFRTINVWYHEYIHGNGERRLANIEAQARIVSLPVVTLLTPLDLSWPNNRVDLKVIVGKERKEFTVKKDLVCSKSEFFRTTCNERWESRWTNTIRLEEGDPTIYDMFHIWVINSDVETSQDYIEV